MPREELRQCKVLRRGSVSPHRSTVLMYQRRRVNSQVLGWSDEIAAGRERSRAAMSWVTQPAERRRSRPGREVPVFLNRNNHVLHLLQLLNVGPSPVNKLRDNLNLHPPPEQVLQLLLRLQEMARREGPHLPSPTHSNDGRPYRHTGKVSLRTGCTSWSRILKRSERPCRMHRP